MSIWNGKSQRVILYKNAIFWFKFHRSLLLGDITNNLPAPCWPSLLTHIWVVSPRLGYHQAVRNAIMTSSNGNIFRVTGPFGGESTCHRWIPLTKASDGEFWCLLWSVPEQTGGQTIETSALWDAIALTNTSVWWEKVWHFTSKRQKSHKESIRNENGQSKNTCPVLFDIVKGGPLQTSMDYVRWCNIYCKRINFVLLWTHSD